MVFAVVPNPARAQAPAVGLPAGSTLVVYHALGRLVSTPASLSFSVAGLPAGVCVVRAIAPGQVACTARLVVA